MLKVWFPGTTDLQDQGLGGTEWINDNVTIVDSGKLGKCLSFNGSSSRLSTTNFELDNTWSFACWVKDDASVTNWRLLIMLNTTGSDADTQMSFWLHTGEKRFEVCANGKYISTVKYVPSQWNHFAATYNGSQLLIYLNGVKVYTLSNTNAKLERHNLTIGARGTNANGGHAGATSYFYGLVNDLRIWDNEVLSPREIKEIAKGLVLHYKLDENLNVMNNCYSYPTFNTSAAAGGWYHWGGSGHIGSYGQNTNKEYIFNKSNTYSHWISDGAEATKPYLVYQSPAFEGGYRSLQCIAKEENGLPITDDILYPSWNARDGGTANDKWTSVTALGNGFYLCKCEGVHQNGSNDLIGFNVKPGYKVYISEAYCENDKEMCSDIFNKNALWETIYDCSGYCNNGELYAVGKNLINKSTITSDCYFNSSGALVVTSGWNCTDYISLKPSTAYIASSISTGGSGTYYVL